MNLLLCIYKSINNTCVFFLLLMELKNNAVYQVVGPSGSGKTHFVCKLFNDMKNTNHVLHGILPTRLSRITSTRNSYIYELPIAKTVRYSNSFIPYCIRKRY